MLAKEGYENFIFLGNCLMQLLGMFVFQIAATLYFHNKRKFHTSVIVPFIIYPICMVVFVNWRKEHYRQIFAEIDSMQNALVDYVIETVSNSKLVISYHRSDIVIDDFEKQIDDYNKTRRNANTVKLGRLYMSIWLGHLITAAWTLWGGAKVLRGELSLGIFLVNIRIYRSSGKVWHKIYGIILDMFASLPTLVRISLLMNLPTDVLQRGEIDELMVASTRALVFHEKTNAHVNVGLSGRCALNMMPIVFKEPMR
jgi:ABC-type bacteriocin/lantibiotic exporter with double-glycine peptidase domain